MISFWVSVNAVVTPPVALAAYAAAGIADADMMKTAFLSTKLASWLYLMPFLFVYTPLLSLNEVSIGIAVRTVITCIIGFVAWVSAFQGYLLYKVKWWTRIILLVISLMLLKAGIITDVIGIVVLAIIFIIQIVTLKKNGNLSKTN
jgi:TRAP-type uncharacterized transport system fused permease subunit